MTPSDEVHQLVHSLSRSEKRYFRLFAGLQKQQGGNYLRLYEALETQPVYNQEALIQEFEGSNLGKYFSAEKNYLQRNLLKSLRNFNSGITPRIRLREMATEVELLMQKGLPGQALRHLQKAKKLALKLDRQLALVELLELESILQKEVRKKGLFKAIEGLEEQRQTSLAKLSDEFHLAAIYNRLFAIQSGEYVSRGEVRRSLVQEIFREAEKCGQETFQGRHLYLQIKAIGSQLLGDGAGVFEAFSAARLHWEAHPSQVKQSPERFRRILTNHLAACFIADTLTPVPETLATLRKSAREGGAEWRQIWYYDFLYCLESGSYAQGRELIPHIEQWIAKNPAQAPVTWEIPMYYNFVVLLFFLEEFSEALQKVQKITQRSSSKMRKEIVRAIRLLEMLIFYEKGEYDLLEYQVRAASEKFRTEAPDLAFEKTVVRFLKEQLANLAGAGKALIFKKFYEEIVQLAQKPKERAALGFMEIAAWAAARARGSKIYESPLPDFSANPS